MSISSELPLNTEPNDRDYDELMFMLRYESVEFTSAASRAACARARLLCEVSRETRRRSLQLRASLDDARIRANTVTSVLRKLSASAAVNA